MPPASRSRASAPRRQSAAPEELRPAPVVLLTGPEDFIAERGIEAVVAAARQADPEVSLEQIEAAAYEAGRLSVVTSPSLFGGGTVVVAKGVEHCSDAFVEDVTAYLEDLQPDVCLVLYHSGGNRAKNLLEAVRATGAPEAVCAAITRDDDKVDFASRELARHGRRASPPALRALVDAVGTDLRELASACSLLAFASEAVVSGDGRIEPDLVNQYFGGRVEATAFRVADAAIAGRADQALGLLRHALATGVDPVPMVAAMAMKIRSLAKVSAHGRGQSGALAKELGMAPWQVERAQRELSGWGEHGLATAVLAAAEADHAVKGGARDAVYAVEKFVLTVAEARGR